MSSWRLSESWAYMRVKIGEISETGLAVAAGIEDGWAVDAVRLGMEGEPQALELEARVQMVSDCVRIHGRLEATTRRDCDRCQTSLQMILSGRLDLYYAPPRAGESGDRDLDRGDLDIGWFDGDALEIAQVISEQLGIWCPNPVLCESDACTRLEPSDGPCEVLSHDGGPTLKPQSPFAGLSLPE